MDNIILIMGLIGVIGIAIAAIYYFMNLSREKQIAMVKEWLILACIEAEKALGSKTGKIKLRYVYDLFLSKFKYLSLVISFEQFSLLVDQALDQMRDMISSNKNIQDYISKE